MGNMAGIASSVYGTCFFFIGAGLGAIISAMIADRVYPLVISFFVIGLVTVVLVFGDKRVAGKP
jgi:DHA1 family bicyclomycin/chloramphenicol resistance-like MFS transporter